MNTARRLRALAQVMKERFGSLADLEKERPQPPPNPRKPVKGRTTRKR